MKRTTLILTQREIARLVDMRLAIRVTRAAFTAMARGDAVMPPKLYLPIPGGNDFRAMPAFLRRPAAAGVKWVNVHPRNRARGLPTVMAVIIINDPATGFPLAVMDGLRNEVDRVRRERGVRELDVHDDDHSALG